MSIAAFTVRWWGSELSTDSIEGCYCVISGERCGPASMIGGDFGIWAKDQCLNMLIS
jgi:hypothetical protein